MFEMTLDELDGITIRPFVPDDAARMVVLQRRTLAQCHDTGLFPEGFYYGPSFDGGENILCAVDQTGAHVGHALVCLGHVHRGLDAWLLWMDLRRGEISLGLWLDRKGGARDAR